MFVFIVKYENIQKYPDEQFHRITGVKRTTFEKIITNLQPAKHKLTTKSDPKPKLCHKDIQPAALEYIQQYQNSTHNGKL